MDNPSNNCAVQIAVRERPVTTPQTEGTITRGNANDDAENVSLQLASIKVFQFLIYFFFFLGYSRQRFSIRF